MTCSPNLGQRELQFSGVMAQVGGGADEPFMSAIGTLLPMALCGRNSLYSLRQFSIFTRASSRLMNQWAFRQALTACAPVVSHRKAAA